MKYSKPEVTKSDTNALDAEVHKHPAFGLVTVGKVSAGGGEVLFGSELRHPTYITIEIQTADLHRSLSNDWVFGRKRVVEIKMSESQWAHFVASQGDGSGTPCTFRYRPEDGSKVMDCDGIEPAESMRQKFEREMDEAIGKRFERFKELEAKVRQLAENGKANKGDLKDILSGLNSLSDGLPRHASFIRDEFHKAMDNTVQAGKVEIEAHVYGMATRLGIEAMKNMAAPTMIESKE